MNIYTKLFITALFMVNVCVYILFREEYYDAQMAFSLHVFGSLITTLFHNKVEKYDREFIKKKKDK